ncbi:MAG: 4-hydroxythreonine-4-phosphate dehydrogenase PdxA [Prevotellaceae bacterium]|nr:4-hydroxythreonine-4-phosphate dehydrogenase PdxA [Prevotellaceae bacterium]
MNKIRIAITKGNADGVNFDGILNIVKENQLNDICELVAYEGCEAGTYDALLTLTAEETTTIAKDFGSIEGATPYILYIGGNIRASVIGKSNDDITADNIEAKIKILHRALKRDMLITNPRIAILAANNEPAKEEEETIKPAIEKLFQSKIQCFGPYEAVKFFEEKYYEDFDIILAMNANQVATKLHDSNAKPLILTLGLPFVHVAAPDITEENIAETLCMITAMCRNRRAFDEAYSNPLPKLYHEQKEGEERRPRFAPLDFMKKDKE